MKEIETEHLLLLHGDSKRDDEFLLNMLRSEGDFRKFAGVDWLCKTLFCDKCSTDL